MELTAPTFLIVLGAIALAVALAFGIGAREVARDILEKAYNRGQEAAPGGGSAGQAGFAPEAGIGESLEVAGNQLRIAWVVVALSPSR